MRIGVARHPRVTLLCRTISVTSAALGHTVTIDAGVEFDGRATERGWSSGSRVSANGTCHLLRAADGWVAVNLARPEDLESVPAILSEDAAGSAIEALRAAAPAWSAAALADRAQLLGVAAAALGSATGPGVRSIPVGAPGHPERGTVVDFSALWAGPLAANILQRSGFQVTTLEHVRRPDPTRRSTPLSHARLRSGQQQRALDFATPAGQAELRQLVDQADVVIEASRPRALARLGLDCGAWLRARPGRTWLSITGYGRDDPGQRIAFGDDAAVAGGLVDRDAEGCPVFRGDAVADPLSGLVAGAAVLGSQLRGGGELIDVSMAGVCADLVAHA